MDRDGNAGAPHRRKGADELLRRVEALRRVAQAQGDAQSSSRQRSLQLAVDLIVMGHLQPLRLVARGVGPQRPAADEHPDIDGERLPPNLLEIAVHRRRLDMGRDTAGDGAHVAQDLRLVRRADRRQGEAAVAVDDRRQSLVQLQLAKIRAEYRRIGVPVDINEARRHHKARRRNDPRRRGVDPPDGGNLPALNGDISGKARLPAAVEQHAIFNQIIKHSASLFPQNIPARHVSRAAAAAAASMIERLF